MGVVNVEQARIEEGVDAVAVVALEHVSADIRKEEDKDSSQNSTINVDYIDESQVLMPADQCYHINKDDFKVPFACGAKNLGEAFRRITEGAAQEAPCGLLLKTIELKGFPFVGPGIFKFGDPAKRAKADPLIVTPLRGDANAVTISSECAYRKGYSYDSLISSSVQSLLTPSTTLPISYAFIAPVGPPVLFVYGYSDQFTSVYKE
nr:12312_t:CDS:2 [Entrophospora candida]